MLPYRKMRPFALIIVLISIFKVSPSAAKNLHFVNEHWPPYVIAEDAQAISGIDVDLLGEIAKRIGVGVDVTICKWIYCLKMMENGRADIISALLMRPEREKYMVYIEPPYILKSTKLFYLPKGKGHLIQKYEDIYELTIGVLNGSAYFLPFDEDKKIQKFEVLKTEQLLQMLNSGRIDAFIGTEIVTDYLIRSGSYKNVFEKSVYRYESETPFYFAVSKKSPFAKRIAEINRVMNSLVKEGRVRAILNKYGSGNQ